jgi:hypothetical protein
MLIRVMSLLGLTGGFLLISPSLRATALEGLGRAMFELAKYSPYSYIALAVALGTGAVLSMSSPRPQ